MYIIEINSYQKPYEDDTGFTNITSSLTAKIDNPINEIEIDLSMGPIELELISQAQVVEVDNKGDYQPLLQNDQTKAF